ncbi:MAG: hypothetical protein IKK53_00910 [Ruminiclostridium sp.]|nr:hypothetical protein [Ruminiclostridium sp.]
MNITFLIGNGFDVNLGLKTLYADFYDTYIDSNESRDNDDPIKMFCDKLKDDRSVYEEYEKNKYIFSKKPDFIEEWKDFEMFFAKHAKGNKDDISKIIADFNNKFTEYLKVQDGLCDYSDKSIIESFKEFVIIPYNHLERKHRHEIHTFYDSKRAEDHTYQFINFNYTNTVSELVRKFKNVYSPSELVAGRKFSNIFPSVLDIHGNINGEYIIVGIDSLEQFSDDNLKNNLKAARHCVKKVINEEFGYGDRETQFAKIIKNSDIIYTYGLAFGATDASRWEIVRNWLKVGAHHKLVIFKYKSGFDDINGMSKGPLYDAIDDTRDEYLKILGFDENENFEDYYNRIYVLDSNKVLNFRLVQETEDNVSEKLEPALP